MIFFDKLKKIQHLKITILAIILLFSNNALSQNNNLDKLNEHQQLRAKKLFREVRCPVCEGQVIDESNTQIAIDLKNFIISEIQNGKNNTEIKKRLIDQFGHDILNEAPFNKQTLALWLLPIILLLLAISYAIFHLTSLKKTQTGT